MSRVPVAGTLDALASIEVNAQVIIPSITAAPGRLFVLENGSACGLNISLISCGAGDSLVRLSCDATTIRPPDQARLPGPSEMTSRFSSHVACSALLFGSGGDPPLPGRWVHAAGGDGRCGAAGDQQAPHCRRRPSAHHRREQQQESSEPITSTITSESPPLVAYASVAALQAGRQARARAIPQRRRPSCGPRRPRRLCSFSARRWCGRRHRPGALLLSRIDLSRVGPRASFFFGFDLHSPLAVRALLSATGPCGFEWHLRRWCPTYLRRHRRPTARGGVTDRP